jgi:hypothetical protein
MNGTPAYCGGSNNVGNFLQCFKLDKVTSKWVKVSCQLEYFSLK